LSEKEEEDRSDSIISYLITQDILEKRRSLKTTLLHRPNGVWHDSEVSNLVNDLHTEVMQHPQFPEHLLLYGHFTKKQTVGPAAGPTWTAIRVTGTDSLPWFPSAWVR